MTRDAPAYYALPDPDDPTVMTYWRRDTHGDLVAHPTRAPYGPMLYRRGEHQHVTPAHLRGPARRNWIGDWYRTVRADWLARVHAAIAADECAAARRFAEVCIGDSALAHLVGAVGRAHVEREAAA